MIKFQKSATNNVVVTLKENSTVANPIYLFRFVSQQTLVDYYFISEDISAYKDRYNKFVVVEDELLEPMTVYGPIVLGKEGYYDYKIYQTNLTPMEAGFLIDAVQAIPNIVKEVEDGLVYVVFAENTDVTYDSIDNTTIVYQPS